LDKDGTKGPSQSPFAKGGLEGDFLHVVAAAIVNAQGRVLIAQRPDHVHQGGRWEFPGGKVEAGESADQALRRELFEELGIRVQSHEPLIQVRYRYPDKAVLLDVSRVTRFSGDCRSCEGQPLAWVVPKELRRFRFPDANLPIVNALLLPDRYLITPDPGQDEAQFLVQLRAALQTGIQLVQLRAPDHDVQRYRPLAEAAIALCRMHGARLLVNAEPEWATKFGAEGVHLNSARLRSTPTRPLPTDEYLVAASCHDADEIAHAAEIGADFVVLSPVKPVPSHPNAKPLGWRRFQALCIDAAMPVYALGGMRTDDLTQAKRHGGQGIAAIRGLWPQLAV
jgi:8-oxo-dGTP diphosphatase